MKVVARQVETAEDDPKAGELALSELPADVGESLRNIVEHGTGRDFMSGMLGKIDWLLRVDDGAQIEIPTPDASKDGKVVADYLNATLPKVPSEDALRITAKQDAKK